MTEGALLADTMTQANGQAAMLPLVSHALLETWRRRGNTLPRRDGHRQCARARCHGDGSAAYPLAGCRSIAPG